MFDKMQSMQRMVNRKVVDIEKTVRKTETKFTSEVNEIESQKKEVFQ